MAEPSQLDPGQKWLISAVSCYLLGVGSVVRGAGTSFFFFNLLAAPCGMWDVGSYFPNQRSNSCSLPWKHRVLSLDHHGSSWHCLLNQPDYSSCSTLTSLGSPSSPSSSLSVKSQRLDLLLICQLWPIGGIFFFFPLVTTLESVILGSLRARHTRPDLTFQLVVRWKLLGSRKAENYHLGSWLSPWRNTVCGVFAMWESSGTPVFSSLHCAQRSSFFFPCSWWVGFLIRPVILFQDLDILLGPFPL